MNSTASQSSSSGCVGEFALRAEIFEALDDAAAEDQLPQPIDEDAGRQRVLAAGDPAGQIEPCRRLVFEPCAIEQEIAGTAGRDDFAGVVEPVAARQACAWSAAAPTSRPACERIVASSFARSFSIAATFLRAAGQFGRLLAELSVEQFLLLGRSLGGLVFECGEQSAPAPWAAFRRAAASHFSRASFSSGVLTAYSALAAARISSISFELRGLLRRGQLRLVLPADRFFAARRRRTRRSCKNPSA